jgi:acyl-CoA synthetase (AMP-forming)/AMP-acid ligase II
MADIIVRDGLEELVAILPAGLSDRKRSIREALAQRLPAYMLPRRYLFTTQFPLNASGKLDRKALRQQVMLEAAR